MVKKRGLLPVMVLTLSLMLTLVLAAASVSAVQGCEEGEQGYYKVIVGPFGYNREFVCEKQGFVVKSQWGFEPFNIFDKYERRARIFSYYRLTDFDEQVAFGVPPNRQHPTSQFHSLFEGTLRRFFGVPPERRHPTSQISLIYGPRETEYLQQYLRFTPPDKQRLDQYAFYHLPETLYEYQKLLAEGYLPVREWEAETQAEYKALQDYAWGVRQFQKGTVSYEAAPSSVYEEQAAKVFGLDDQYGRYEQVR